jgi:hypothetical protein
MGGFAGEGVHQEPEIGLTQIEPMVRDPDFVWGMIAVVAV